MTRNLYKILGNRSIVLVITFVAMLLVFAFTTPEFLSLSKLLGITQFGAPLVLLTMGEALVILLGQSGIDLSISSNMSLSGVAFGYLTVSGLNIFFAAILTFVFSYLLGSINGYAISYLGFSPMITTLGSMYIFESVALYVTKGKPISGFPMNLSWLGHGDILGVPNQILFVVAPIVLAFWYICEKTGAGRRLYLTGSNNQAAELTGLDPKRLRFVVYGIAGLMSGVAAVIMSAWLMTSKADVGKGMEMQAITAAILGGFSINGGTGKISGVVLAVLLLTTIKSGLQMSNISSVIQLGVLGALLIGVLIIDSGIKNKSVSHC